MVTKVHRPTLALRKLRAAALDTAIQSGRMEDARPTSAGLKVMASWARGQLTAAQAEAELERLHRVQVDEVVGHVEFRASVE